MSLPGYAFSTPSASTYLPSMPDPMRIPEDFSLFGSEWSVPSYVNMPREHPGFLGPKPSNIINAYDLEMPAEAGAYEWGMMSRNMINEVNDKAGVFELPHSSPVPMYDIGQSRHIGDFSGQGRTISGANFSRAESGFAAGAARSESIMESSLKWLSRMGGSATEKIMEGSGTALKFLLSNLAYYGTLVAIPAAVVYHMAMSTYKVIKSLGNFIVRVAKWVGNKLLEGTEWAFRHKEIHIQKDIDEKISHGWRSATNPDTPSGLVSRGVKSLKRGIGQAGRTVGKAASSAARGVGRAMTSAASSAGEKVGEIASRGISKAKVIGTSAMESVGELYALGSRGAQAAARAGSQIVESKAFKVASGVFQIASDAFQLYMFYNQATELHAEVGAYNELKNIINNNMHGETNFQVDEFMRQREASIQQHRINLAINGGLTAAGIAVGTTMLVTGAAFLGPIGWLALGIAALTVGASYYMEKIDRDRIKNDDDAWLKKWYGSAEHPSLQDYLMKRDPSGDLSNWVKGMHDLLDSTTGTGKDKFATYMYLLVQKIDVIMDSKQAGLFDDRFERLSELQATNPIAGATILGKRWEGQTKTKEEQDNNFMFEEGSLLSSTIDYEIKQGKLDEVHADVTQEDLDHFFRDQPEQVDAEHPDTKAENDAVAKNQLKPLYTDKDGNFVPYAQSTQWQAAQDRAELTARRKKQGLDADGAPDYYSEGGWRPTGGQSIRGSWEEIGIKEDEQQAAEEQAEKDQAVANLEISRENAVNREIEGQDRGNTEQSNVDQNNASAKEKATPNGPLWHYPENSRESYTQQGLLYDAAIAYKRQRL